MFAGLGVAGLGVNVGSGVLLLLGINGIITGVVILGTAIGATGLTILAGSGGGIC